jgi:hypothetical protein
MVRVTRILKSRSTLGNEEFVNREIALKRKHDRSQIVMYQLRCHIVANEELWKLKYFTMQKYNLQMFL